MRRSRSVMMTVALALAVGACGDDSIGGDGGGGIDVGGGGGIDVGGDDESDFGDALADALPGGGGGILIFDGEEIPIASATCVFGEDGTFDSGTVSDNGFRVFAGTNNPANPVSAQILDADFLQWFPRNVSGDEAQRTGDKTITSGPHQFFNNSDDRLVEASFTIECP